jgi:hypothetical protein
VPQKDHSADSKIRLSHGAALESVSRYSYATALLLPRTEKDVAARLYQQAIDSLQQANSIREKGAAVDPANGEWLSG